jgi:hypothetical protein
MRKALVAVLLAAQVSGCAGISVKPLPDETSDEKGCRL